MGRASKYTLNVKVVISNPVVFFILTIIEACPSYIYNRLQILTLAQQYILGQRMSLLARLLPLP